MAKRKAADGAGSIRQRPDGRWEARFTFTDELGQKKRSSIYGDTQKEVRQKLTSILKAVDSNTYHEAKRYTVSEWLDEWIKTYPSQHTILQASSQLFFLFAEVHFSRYIL